MTEKVIDEIINYDGIEEVLLIKRMVWFYYRELGLYDEKNERIVNILTNKKCSQKSKIYNNKVKVVLLKESKDNKVENKNIIGDFFREDNKRYQKMEEELMNELENF